MLQRVNHLLKGNPNVEKHWNQEKERFSSYAVSYSDNNKILEEFKGIYWKLIQEHPELNARQISNYYKTKAQESLKKMSLKTGAWMIIKILSKSIWKLWY